MRGKIPNRRYVLFMLTTLLVVNKIDAPVLNLLMQDIKRDLQLTDTQLGLLSGIAFSLFYSLAGIPLARIADRGNRIFVISVSTVVQSVATALSGVASNFAQLLAVRVCIAAGEAGCVPPSNSIIAESFSREDRPRAAARYMTGFPLSMLLGYFLAGLLNDAIGWRATWIVIGIPGAIIALVAWFTLPEPRNGLAIDAVSREPTEPEESFASAVRSLWQILTYRHLVMAFCLQAFFGVGVFNWAPTYLIRTFDVSSGYLGPWLALIYGAGGFAGALLGGEVANRFARGNECRQLKGVGLIYSAFAAISACLFLAPTLSVALGFLLVANISFYATTASFFSAVQSIVPTDRRSTAFAILYLCANLVGAGLGPVVAGALSDHLAPWAGPESLKWALIALSPGYLWAAYHLWRSSSLIMTDLARGSDASRVAGQRDDLNQASGSIL